jgi:DNA-binding FadR family transcriptional regulator
MLDVVDSFRDRMVFKIVTFRKLYPNNKPHVALRTHNAMYRALARGAIPEAASELMRNLGDISKYLMKRRLI